MAKVRKYFSLSSVLIGQYFRSSLPPTAVKKLSWPEQSDTSLERDRRHSSFLESGRRVSNSTTLDMSTMKSGYNVSTDRDITTYSVQPGDMRSYTFTDPMVSVTPTPGHHPTTSHGHHPTHPGHNKTAPLSVALPGPVKKYTYQSEQF